MKRKIWTYLLIGVVAAGIGLTPVCAQAQEKDPVEEAGGMGYVPEPDENLWAKPIYDEEDNRIGDVNYPEYYLNTNIPAIRNQGYYGTCWAHAVLALTEINMMKQGYAEPDYSEMHLAYYSYFTQNDPLGGLEGDYKVNDGGFTFLNRGGNFWMASSTLRNWKGAAQESLVPHTEDVAYEIIENGLPAEYAFQDVAYLKNFYWVNTTEEQAMKLAITEYGALAISYYSDMSFLNYETGAYYCPYEYTVNHSVVIVGWDDNYPASNFEYPPSRNGAWIVRNSWGEDHANDGYFYMSYDEASLSATAMAAEAVPSSAYDYNYQYDGANNSWYYYNRNNTYNIKGANVFTAAASPTGAEMIDAVGFGTQGANYLCKVSVYKNLTDSDNPESGTLAASVEGYTTFAGGYTVDLPTPVYVQSGETFSVVVEYWSDADMAAIIGEGTSEYTNGYSVYASAKPGQSYMYINGWYDFGKANGKNLAIKAYTTETEIRVPCPTPGYTGLAQAADGTWYYFTDGYADYSYNGLAPLGNDWWMVVNGKLDFGYNGLTFYNNEWLYVEGGRYNTAYNGLAFVNDAWWYVVNGKVDFTYSGLSFVNDAWWYVTQGRIDFTYNGLVLFNDIWWYVEGGCVNFGFNGLSFVNDAWWYVVNGQIDFNYSGLAFYNNDWWYVQGGQIDFAYTGLTYYNNTWWYVENGKINFAFSGLSYVNDAWWYVQGGMIDFSYTGLAFYNEKWWYVTGAKVDFTYEGEVFFNDAWWYVRNGELATSFTGLVTNDYGTWYYQNGKLDFAFSGIVEVDGVQYQVENGKVLGVCKEWVLYKQTMYRFSSLEMIDYVSYIYTYDTEGNIVQQNDYNVDGTLKNSNTYTWEYCYNQTGQIVKESQYGADNVLLAYNTFEYDVNGNNVKEVCYDSSNAVIKWYQRTYDEHNHITKETEYDATGAVANKTVTVNEYDENGKLIKTTSTIGSKIYEYIYNENEQKVEGTYYLVTPYLTAKILTFNFIYDENNNLIEATSFNGVLIQHRVLNEYVEL